MKKGAWKTTVYEHKGMTKLISVSDDGGVRFSKPNNSTSKWKKPQEKELMNINSAVLDLDKMIMNVDFSFKNFDDKKLSSVNPFIFSSAPLKTSIISPTLFAIDSIVSKEEDIASVAYGGRHGLLRIQNVLL